MRYFDKTNEARTLAEKYAYIKNHFQYWTANSWNGKKSIANNVKVYNLNLSDSRKALDIVLCDDDTFELDINAIIEDSGLNIGANGSSGGYMVLYPDKGSRADLRGDYYEETYKEAKRDGDIDKDILLADFERVQAFDRACDDMRDLLEYYIKNAQVVNEEYTITKTHTVIRFDDEVEGVL